MGGPYVLGSRVLHDGYRIEREGEIRTDLSVVREFPVEIRTESELQCLFELCATQAGCVIACFADCNEYDRKGGNRVYS